MRCSAHCRAALRVRAEAARGRSLAGRRRCADASGDVTFEITLNDRSRSVSIERAGQTPDGALRLRVSVDGESSLVDVQRSGDFGLSLVFQDSADRSTTVHVAPGQAPGELLAYLAGRVAAVSVNASRTGRGAADAGGSAPGEQTIVAPMPGRVVRVLVTAGETVEPR